MEAIKLCRLDTPIIFIEARINLSRDRKSGSAGMPRPISYAVFCLKKNRRDGVRNAEADDTARYDASSLSNMVSDVEALTLSFYLTGDARYSAEPTAEL